MLNKFKRFILILCCLPLLNAAALPNFQINGIDGELLLNVQRRLTELYQAKVITNQRPEELTLQIEKALYPYGYFKPKITIASANNTILNIHIMPGPQMHITSLVVEVAGEGANNPKIQQTLHSLPIKSGQPLINTQYEDAKDKLTVAAESEGYLHASFEKAEVLVDKQEYTAKITLLFTTGPRYYFGQLRFNPTYISPDLLRRFVPFKYGQPYSTEEMLTLNSNLAASGYFKSVNVKPTIQDEPLVPIDVSLKPSDRVSYSLGAGYGTDTGPRGLAGIHVVPVNRAGHKFNAIAQGSFEESALQAQYIIPGFNPVIDKYSISGGVTNLNYNSGDSTAFLLSVAQQHALSNYQRILSINALNEHFGYTGFTTIQKSLIYPKAIFSWNNTTDPLFSPSGYNITLSGLAANKAILSQVNVAQASIDGKVAITIDPIRTRLYLHGIQGVMQTNNIYQVPLSLAQLLGGAGNMKGFSYNSLGPGKIITYGGVEVQKETFKKWYLLGFFDSGDVYNPTPRAFQYDVGAGLMWVSPVGPIKIGLAQQVDNKLNRISGRTPKLVINMGPDLS
jgi:translocation and assembly module TamA